MKKQTVLRILTWLSILSVLALVSIVLWSVISSGRQTRASLLWLQGIQSFAIFILPPILCALLWYKRDWATALGLSTKRSFSDSDLSTKWSASAAVLLMILVSPGISLLSYWNQSITFPPCLAELESSLRTMEERAADLILLFAKAENIEVLAVNVFVMAVLPAFGEELTFRGLLFSFFKKENKLSTNKLDGFSKLPTLNSTLMIWISAIIFSAVHMQFFGFIPRMLLGALFGYVYLWSGSLWLPIIMHATNNAFAVIMYNVFDWCGKNPATLDTFGTGDTLWVGILSLVLTAVGIYFFRLLLRRTKNGSSLTY